MEWDGIRTGLELINAHLTSLLPLAAEVGRDISLPFLRHNGLLKTEDCERGAEWWGEIGMVECLRWN